MGKPLASALAFLLPWDFFPTVALATLAATAAYLRGWRRCRADGQRIAAWRPAAFLGGVLLLYVCMQTHLDYLAQHLFWVHRAQHAVLHHLAPFLIALSAPDQILLRGTPRWFVRRVLRPVVAHRAARAAYRCVQQPVVAGILFVGLIYFWMTPAIHFDAMLSLPIYEAMNWSMVIDGLLFWSLMVGPERSGAPHYGTRMAVLFAITLPQSVLGAYLTFHQGVLYDVYDVCGRVGDISPLLDQQLGGLNTWIPPGMMSAAGLAVLASRWLRSEPGVRGANLGGSLRTA